MTIFLINYLKTLLLILSDICYPGTLFVPDKSTVEHSKDIALRQLALTPSSIKVVAESYTD